MSVSALVTRGRAFAESVMVDTCTIQTETRGALNTTTGAYAASTFTTVYSGKCRVKGPPAGGGSIAERQAGDAEQPLQRQTLVIPHGSAASISVGDKVTITGSNSGVEFRVVGDVDSTTMTARSILVEAVRP